MSNPSDYGLTTDLGPYADDWVGGWVCLLSDGTEVFQNDGETSSWLNLKSYLQDSGLTIQSFQLRFRTNHKQIGPLNGRGYFYRKGCFSFLTGDKTYHQAIAGFIREDSVHVTKYRFPELTIDEEELREIDKCQESLIINGQKENS